MASSKSTSTPEEVQARTMGYMDKIAACYDGNHQVVSTVFKSSTSPSSIATSIECLSGKVRDRFVLGSTNKLALVTTDRQSGFDRQLAVVPFKGAVLNLTSAYWFEVTKDIIPNHLIDIPHPNVAIVHKCTPFPIEFVVRGYLTGSTDTSIWKHYSNGVRNYCGHDLPDNMVKNQKLPEILLTPTTKEEDHDRPISAVDIVQEGWMTQDDFDVCAEAALRIFRRGQELAEQRGMILVDTKYEFGTCTTTTTADDGTTTTARSIVLIDEVHTPDSSRWWLLEPYEEKFQSGEEPENISKEFLRLWYRDHCDPYKDATIPDAPRDLVLELSRRYICLYEIITGKEFDFNAISEQEEGQDIISKILERELEK